MGYFSIGGSIRSTVNMGQIASGFSRAQQDAIGEAERAGREVLIAQTPIGETENLSSSIETGENQFVAWFRVAGTINGKPYGFAQEHGWHDRADNFHEGHHMVEHAGEAAAEAYVAFMDGAIGLPTISGAQSFDRPDLGVNRGTQGRGGRKGIPDIEQG